jgi:Uma2 family endonuclease
MPLYARYGVPFAWLVDPIARTLETYELEAGDWREIGRFSDADQVAAAPFEAATLDLDGLWVPERRGSEP